MFSASDPRAALAPRISSALRNVRALGQTSYVPFAEIPPQISDKMGQTWLARGQNFVVALTRAAPNARLFRSDHPDEYMALILDEGVAVRAEASGRQSVTERPTLFIMPPGDSAITLPTGGRIYRIFSSRAGDLARACANSDTYAAPQPNLPSFEPWPAPAGGFNLRAYDLDVPAELQKHGRIWRSTNLLIYLSEPRHGPRDIHRLSPHHHEDFEQCTINVFGDVVQHARWPWTPDMALWRDDEHVRCPQDSVAVFPPFVTHTTQYLSEGVNVELVIFAPPRLDWSLQPDWVLNGSDYPLPGTSG